MGRPVVAVNRGGPTEIIDDGLTGLLVPPHDDEALAAGIVALLQDPERARRLGEAGRRAVVERFSAEDHARRVARVYAGALGRPGASPSPKPLVRTARPADRGHREA